VRPRLTIPIAALRAAAAVLIAGAACAPAAALATSVATGLSAANLFTLADRAIADHRPADALAIYTALSHDPDPEIRAEARFRKGQMLADAKRYADAAITFRQLLDEKPNAAGVRLELVRVLSLMGEDRAARRELRQVEAGALPREVRIAVDQFADALRSPNRLGGSIGMALAPDSNINRATSARTLDTIIAPLTLSDDAREHSGLGLKLSGQGYARFALSRDITVLPRLSGAGNFYREGRFNDISGSAQLALEWQKGRDRISPSGGQTWRWYGGNLYARTTNGGVEWLHLAGRRTQTDVSFSIGRAHYLTNDQQDGMLYDGSVTVERAFSARLGGSFGLSATRQTARDAGYATISGGPTLLLWRELGKSTIFASTSIRRLEGDARLFLFVDRRREWLMQLTGGATLRGLSKAGFAPTIRLTYERNSSTVGLYDYRRLSAEFGIARAF
jgi:tetratricopeptide (TPR) repeat protein